MSTLGGNGAAPTLHRNASTGTVLLVGETLMRRTMAPRLHDLRIGQVHQAASAAAALEFAALAGPCALAVIDLIPPDTEGIRLVRELKSRGWPQVLVVVSPEEPLAVAAAFQAGAQGYLLRPGREVAVPDPVWELTNREIDVLRLVADGRSNKDIGGELGLSARTVDTHLWRIGRRLGSGDRALLVTLALRAGIIT
ncbi:MULTISPECIES: LuxR C-terminal-related transcriptional regulator [unclassified Crossiella]|uniref:response regulator transcription factor n=1 Tax=unclassified Crossiella TaxID=2620835 RepID=UPI0020004DAD|nr:MULTISPECIES: LuxR C-terminal-related transcriptional regulator [unclassified Crossiella]MCK2241583.1 LuxR C-terminal-related transcriptional regulator [Crossiella sp. S99.2]MCK2255545.1 LuxR C-terminal-related transcriptional regulator [Crossiella sp. S99.1]